MQATADLSLVGILTAHQELLADPELLEQARALISQGKSAAFAWKEAFNGGAARLSALNSPLLRERANDLRDVGRRVLALLTGSTQAGPEMPADAILITEELRPSEAAQLDPAQVRGLCTTKGGPTGHVAILARSLGIPAICGIDEAALSLPGQTLVVLDGNRGILNRQPSESELGQARQQIELQLVQRTRDRSAAQKPAVTLDGFCIEVAANIRNAKEAQEASRWRRRRGAAEE